MPPALDVCLLLNWRQGEAAALDKLLPLVYSELRKIAHARMRAESPGVLTLQTTALVNETYVRLVDGARIDWQNRTHFYAVCARLMRRICVCLEARPRMVEGIAILPLASFLEALWSGDYR